MPEIKGMYDNIIPEKPNFTFWSSNNENIDKNNAGNTGNDTNQKPNKSKNDKTKAEQAKNDVLPQEEKKNITGIDLKELNDKLSKTTFLNGSVPGKEDKDMIIKLSKLGNELNN